MTVTFIATAALMLLIGFLFCSWPLLRAGRYGLAGVVLVALIGASVALYPLASNFEPRSAAYLALTEPDNADKPLNAEAASAMADTLAAELEEQPDDFASWRLLGSVRLRLEQYEAAEAALRRAMQLSEFPDPELMVMMGESLSYGDVQRLPNEAIVLFIGAYEMAPDIPKAMWYGGLAYASRGEHARAADAWERLLAQGAPDEISAILRERIIALRAMANRATPNAEAGRSLTLNVALVDGFSESLPQTARVFISVRNPVSPGPPLAAVQRAPDALPLTVTLSDSDAMLPGRNLSSAERYDITARVSMNGDPLGGPGDYIGTISVDANGLAAPLALLIDTVVAP